MYVLNDYWWIQDKHAWSEKVPFEYLVFDGKGGIGKLTAWIGPYVHR